MEKAMPQDEDMKEVDVEQEEGDIEIEVVDDTPHEDRNINPLPEAIKEELEKPKDKKKEPLKARNKDQNKPTNIDTEFNQDDKFTELLVTQKELEEENTKLLDQLALKVMDVTPEQKKMAEKTIEELRADNKRLEQELESMTVSRNSYMRENAEMKKQLNWYKKQLQKFEKEAV
jgi:hypothetical protein